MTLLRFSACAVDLDRRTIDRPDGPSRLTTTEAALLRYLAERAGEPVPRTELLEEVWGYAPGVESRSVDTAVRRVRAKIEADKGAPDHLLPEHGLGYRLVVFGPDDPADVAAVGDEADPVDLTHRRALVRHRVGRARALGQMADWSGGLSEADAALALAQSGDIELDVAEARYIRGALLFGAGRASESAFELRAALPAFVDGNDPRMIGACHHGLGAVALVAGDLEGAEAAFVAALAGFGADSPDGAWSWAWLAAVRYRRGAIGSGDVARSEAVAAFARFGPHVGRTLRRIVDAFADVARAEGRPSDQSVPTVWQSGPLEDPYLVHLIDVLRRWSAESSHSVAGV